MRTRLIVLILGLTATVAYAVSLAWNPNPETNLIGYNLYVGTNSGQYLKSFFIVGGRTTNFSISSASLFQNRPNYLALTAQNTGGLESGYSNEVIYTNVTTLDINLQVHPAPKN